MLAFVPARRKIMRQITKCRKFIREYTTYGERDQVAKGRENSDEGKVIAGVPLSTSEAGIDLGWWLFTHSLVSDSLQPHGLPYACSSLSLRVSSNSCPLSP